MAIFIHQGRYSEAALKGLMANPEDRAEAVAKLLEAAGGKMLAYYVTLGEYDYMVISDMPGTAAASAAAVAAAASGGVAGGKTTAAMTSAEAKDVFAAAGRLASSFKAAGQ